MKSGNVIHEKLVSYKKRYFLNKLLKGGILFMSTFLAIYLAVSVLEFSFRFGSPIRTILFFSVLAVFVYFMIRWVVVPIYQLATLNRQLSDEEAARQIGAYFPDIKDKLLNLIQLEDLSASENALVAASITQRTQSISLVPFDKAVEIKKNRKYLKYLAYPAIVIFLILLFVPALFTESTTRMLNYEKEFVPEAPFRFEIRNKKLEGFKNEDFKLEVDLEGKFIPEELFLDTGYKKVRLKKSENGKGFQYTFKNLQSNINFTLEAAGYRSERRQLAVYPRPNIREYFVKLNYPAYTRKEDEIIKNIANITVPEGTEAEWNFGTSYTDSITVIKDQQTIKRQIVKSQFFTHSEVITQPTEIEIKISNANSSNLNKLLFRTEVIKDEYPRLEVNRLVDTLLYSFVILGGNVTDDYGLRSLKLFYRNGTKKKYSAVSIPFDKSRASSSFYYQWNMDSLNLEAGQDISYYIEVGDNDVINGSKKARSPEFTFRTPSREEVDSKLEKSSKAAEKSLDENLQKTKDLKERIKKLEDRLKTEQKVGWQEKKMVENLLEKKQELTEALEKLKEENKALNEAQKRFKQPSPKLQEKLKSLQQLMNEVLDEETKKLYDELRKLLEDNAGADQLREKMQDIRQQEENAEKELERALELFKRLKMETKVEETIDKLEELQKKQEELSEETLQKDVSKDDLQQKQQQLEKEMQEVSEQRKEIEDLNQELENPDAIQDFEEQEKKIEESMDDGEEQLENNKRKKSSQSQKKAAEEMKKMKEMMQSMQSGSESEMMEENLDNLRDIVDNLVKLSFSQENLLKNFQDVNQSDPRYIELAQLQLKLKDDSEIIKDSLNALAKRVFQISSFVTREVSTMNRHMDTSVEAIRDRDKSKAVSSQQFAMTSMNNLAILLDDVLQQMQQNMAEAQGKPKKGGKKGGKPSLSQLQKELSKKIQDLKKSGKSGRQLSEELAKLAAEQEMLRREMEKAGKDGTSKEQPGEEGADGNMKKLLEQLKKNEEDLVNKRLSRELINRQEDIITRMLEAEESLRERELDDKREAESPEDYSRKLPPEFEEYFKAKEREIELIKTIPFQLNPFYKKEVNQYFKRINQ